MKKIYSFFVLTLLFAIFAFGNADAQVAVTVTNPTNTTPPLAGSYTSLANAITALNGITAISGGTVTLTAAAGTETAPAGGYAINFTAVTTASDNVVITGTATTTITAPTPQTIGNLNDAIFKIIGSDFVTIQNFTMLENAANIINTPATSNNMTEWGVALLYASTTNGAQNNTIQNNIISLNRTYLNTFGIYSNTRHSATAVTTSAEVTSAAGSNSNNKVYGNAISNVNYGIVFIGAGTTIAAIDNGNDIGGSSSSTGNTITNWGGGAALSSYTSLTGLNYCIFDNQQINDNISYNTITSGVLTQAVTTGGILKNYSIGQPTGTITTTINNNTVTVTNNPTTGSVVGINNQGLTALSTATVSISNNTILNSAITGALATSGSLVGITNSSAPGTLNINTNIVRGMSSTATTGQMQGVVNSGAVVTVLNMNNNQLGNASGGYFSSSVTSSGSLFGVISSGGASTCATTIQNNDIRGITYSVAASAAQNFIQNTAAVLTSLISNNTFTNLNINTTGTTTFISETYTASATATKTVSNNSIVTAFNRGGVSGSILLVTDNGSSVTGSVSNCTNNNFSNITVVGTTAITGLNFTDGGTSPTKIITGNTFNSWTAITGAVNVINVTYWNGVSSLSTNTVTNITGQSNITGITMGSTANNATSIAVALNTINNLISTGTGGAVTGITCANTSATININNNPINTLSTTGASAVVGIGVTGATSTNVFKNKIYDLSGSNASSTVNGVLVSSGTTINIFNNIIGDLRTPAANASNPLNGINITGGTTVNIYYNTVWLNATSSGINFGSSAISASTTPTVTFRNNIFVNTSTPNGTGLTVSHRRSSTTLTTYGATSNNNLYYTSATPDATHLIFYDGTNSDQTLAAYKTRVSPRDAQSVTENPNFLSTVGSSPIFLHINTTTATQIESGGANIAGITDDFDSDIRQGNGGYTGTGTAPDIGADEFNGVPADLNGPSITYTPLTDTCGFGNRNLNNVVITDGSGVAGGANAPRVYWRVNGGSWASAATGSVSSPYNFIIGTTGLVNGDVVNYFVIAQDNAGNVSANPGSGLVATDVNTITTFPTNPNTYLIVCTDNVGVTATSLNVNGVYSSGKGYTFTATVKNFGTVTQTTVPVFFTDNGGAPNGPVNTVGPIITNGTENVTFSGGFAFTPSTGGVHIVKIYTALAADTAKGNDTLTITLNVNALAKISTYPYIQTFTNPVGWTVLIENAVGTTPLWGLGICTNPDGKVGDTAATSNCFNGSAGRKEVFRSPEMDFTSLTNPVLNFYVAYKTFQTENDSMEVLVSTNQGISFFSATTVFNKGNASVPSLATRPPSTTQFFPDSSIQWRHETINLSNIAGTANIVIGFRSKSQFGNRQWVDNVIVTNDNAICNNTVTTPGVYNCNPNLSLNFGTVGLRPTDNPVPTASNILKANSDIKDLRILDKLNSAPWSGEIISSTELDSPTGGVATILQFNNSASAAGAGFATNAGATTQDGTVLTPNKIITNSYFTTTYTGNDKSGYATYSISINATAFPGILNYNKAYIVKRSDLLGKWVSLSTTTSGTTLTSSGLKTFSDFALAVDSTTLAPTKFYVNDNVLIGDVYTTAVGNDANNGTPSDPFATIAYALTKVLAGDTLYVDAGNYPQASAITIPFKLTIYGSNAGINPSRPSKVFTTNDKTPSGNDKILTGKDKILNDKTLTSTDKTSGESDRNVIPETVLGTRNAESIIDYTGLAGAGAHISINSTNQVILDGLDFKDDYVITAAGDRPIILVNAHGNHMLLNNIFSRAAASAPYTASDASPRAIEMTGIPVSDIITISNNRITGNSSAIFSNANFRTGIYYNGGLGTVNITNNLFEFCRGVMNVDDITAGLNISGNSFANNGTAISIGGTIPPSGSFALGPNDYSGTGAIINCSNVAPGFYLDIISSSYAGTPFSSLTLSQLFGIEALMVHGTNIGKNGLVRVRQNHVYVLPTTALATALKGGLQRGVNIALVSDTVNTQTGNYPEQIEINKNLYVIGQGAGATNVIATSTMPLFFTTSSNNYPVIYAHNAATVVVQDLTVDGAGQGNSYAGNNFLGVGYYEAGGTIRNLEVKAVRNSPLDGAQGGLAIYGYDVTTARTLNIVKNNIYDFQKNGITLRGAVMTALIDSNTISGIGSTPITAQNGIQISDGKGTISNNHLSAIYYSGTGYVACGILSFDNNADTLSIKGNTLDTCQASIYLENSKSVISSNVINGGSISDILGLYILSFPSEVTNTIIANNAISGCGWGAYIYSDPGASADAKIHNNSITGSGTFAIQNDGSVATVDAECNWYGTASEAGIASQIDGAVDYTPWLTNGTDNDPSAIGFQPVPNSCNGLPLITGKLDLRVHLEAYSPHPDTIIVTLRSTVTPYPIVAVDSGVINANGNVSLNFSNISNGPSYYIIVNHRQSIETWSATGQMFSAGLMTYDFTTNTNKAFGNNMILVGGLASIYTGDVNQDGIVDLGDLGIMENDVSNYVTGPYVITDLNGDGITDLTDYAFTDNNAYNVIDIEKPNLRPGQKPSERKNEVTAPKDDKEKVKHFSRQANRSL